MISIPGNSPIEGYKWAIVNTKKIVHQHKSKISYKLYKGIFRFSMLTSFLLNHFGKVAREMAKNIAVIMVGFIKLLTMRIVIIREEIPTLASIAITDNSILLFVQVAKFITLRNTHPGRNEDTTIEITKEGSDPKKLTIVLVKSTPASTIKIKSAIHSRTPFKGLKKI
jgi:hypothetical protein